MKSCITLLVVFVVAMVDGNSLRSRYVDSYCPRVCHRMLRPVCGEVNGVPVSISNNCMLDNLIHCESSETKIWKFVHVGSCQSSDVVSEEDEVTESEPNLSEESVEYEIDGKNLIDDDQVDEVFHWSLDYELKEDYEQN